VAPSSAAFFCSQRTVAYMSCMHLTLQASLSNLLNLSQQPESA